MINFLIKVLFRSVITGVGALLGFLIAFNFLLSSLGLAVIPDRLEVVGAIIITSCVVCAAIVNELYDQS
jgi:type III secretory pathway component EscR